MWFLVTLGTPGRCTLDASSVLHCCKFSFHPNSDAQLSCVLKKKKKPIGLDLQMTASVSFRATSLGVFFIFIFFENIFYINIFLILQFTVLYPYRPPGGRQAPCRHSTGRQGGSRLPRKIAVAIRCILDMDTNKNH